MRDTLRTALAATARRALPAVAVALLALSPPLAALDFSGSAFVGKDGSLRVAGRSVRLAGIWVPPTREDCRRFERPPRCGSRAALALDFHIQGFVHCEEGVPLTDGSVEARCFANRGKFDRGSDLGAYLLERGWAVALPEAPPEYHLLERIAWRNGFGVWGLPGVVDPARIDVRR